MAYIPKACGFVLVREGAPGWEYLVLTSRRHGEAGLPKGHVDRGESEIETARRETAEETGLSHVIANPHFRTAIEYPVERKGRTWTKTVVYFLGRTGREPVCLSDEHTSYSWLPLPDALQVLPHENLRAAVRQAALFLKDPALFATDPVTASVAESHLLALPHGTDRMLGHVRGGASIASTIAAALAERGKPVDVQATGVGALLHDVGRFLGEHDDHSLAGLRHLRATDLAPYAFSCVSHFTKGAFASELLQAGLTADAIAAYAQGIDTSTLTWEEHCVALADACMKHDTPVPPHDRFEDLRSRYDAKALIDLQERRTLAIRRTIAASLGHDPLALVGLGDVTLR